MGIYKQLWIASILLCIFEIIAVVATYIGSAYFWDEELYWIIYYYYQTIFMMIIVYVEVPSIENLRKRDRESIMTKMPTLKATGAKTIDLVHQVNQDLQSRGGTRGGIKWIDIVVTTFGYESFINFLETEFAVENLVFITEYVQVKMLLQRYFNDDIINDINKNSKFNISLPFEFDENYKANNEKQKNTDIHHVLSDTDVSESESQSHDQSQSEPDLEEQEQQQQDSGYHDGDSKRERKKSKRRWTKSGKGGKGGKGGKNGMKKHNHYNNVVIPQSHIVKEFLLKYASDDVQLQDRGIGIIEVFANLYSKYIDPNKAPLMINISDPKRKQLIEMLDTRYYKYQMQNIEIGNKEEDVSGDYNHLRLIEKYWQEKDYSIKWLLNQLVEKMDQAALEIGYLMNESFVRFKSNNPIIFAKAYKMAKHKR